MMRNLFLLPAAVAFKRGARVLPRVRGGALSSTATAQHFIDDVNAQYEALHTDFEAQFWGTKMALSTDHEPLSGPKRAYSVAELTKTKQAMEAFLGDEAKLETARALLAATDDAEEKKTLELMTRAFGCYIMESEEAKALRASATETEGALESARNSMTLGATFDGAFEELSSVALRSRMRVDGDETAQGLLRRPAALGYVDYYDYKVTQAEGFGKAQLFGMLDELERASRPIMEAARETLAADKGADALEPWNRGFAMAGDITRKLDPYFPFEKAVEVWGRSFAAMKITYKGASMDLDLLDRKGKYSNGFCHWPQPAWRRSDGSWQPAVTHFTSLADPSAVGSGMTGLVTLMHEAGHAAHFANTDVRSPLFSQERAPTSVPYAELQSMFLDSLVGDAAWRGTYAKSRGGDVVPWALLEEDLTATHPYKVLALRSMLSVPYFEKALYEMADEDLTAASVAAGGAAAYDAAVAAASAASTDVDLDMRVRIVDGDAVLADTAARASSSLRRVRRVTAKYPAPK
ncbi:peptidase [Aureococcus anophagefferens]|nr:peptidase [Aureococcus anophagefferens]